MKNFNILRRIPISLYVMYQAAKLEDPRRCCTMGYPSETHLKLKSHEILFIHNIHFSDQIIFKFCTEHGSNTAVLCAKFHNDLTTEQWGMGKWDFTRFEFEMRFRWISFIVQQPMAPIQTWDAEASA